MKRLFYLMTMFFLICSTGYVKAQYAYFPTEGTIMYDKTIHVKNLLKRHISTLNDDDWSTKYFEELMQRVNETTVLKKRLSFRGNEMSFESVKETYDPIINNLLRQGLLDYQGTLYQDLSKSVSRSSFDLGGSSILLKDSLLNVKWKITNEYRSIAGYECRRANGVTLDSVYVVAFFTDQIPTTAGPGTVHGLPGMILGLVVPEQHFNIYATKVEFNQPTLASVTEKKRDTPMSRKEAQAKLKDLMGRWMSEQQFNLMIAAMFL
ncbi:GLPGLI family protein [Sphingobacterium sp. UT-1RO-CII-1]|uniref:GLPGLI family protein n=1 Tax=Sphingobacterium sp. UT-1RO-CII-1 TaxID=2995225 RepID=UPI00227D3E6C|nr:GLPGLI family protein [Sphingobacterium sp. UT-1RO-CII-1]MCY4778166.1 GLPGLI family protein [Sphingobacterium sp. UT-1RO-CII-1]